MNCNKTIDSQEINEELYLSEIETSKLCISKCLNIDVKNIIEIEDEIIYASINNREYTKCRRKLYDFSQGILECYISVEFKFIEIFHHFN